MKNNSIIFFFWYVSKIWSQKNLLLNWNNSYLVVQLINFDTNKMLSSDLNIYFLKENLIINFSLRIQLKQRGLTILSVFI